MLKLCLLIALACISPVQSTSYENLWADILGGPLPGNMSPYEQFGVFYKQLRAWVEKSGIDLSSRPMPDAANPYPYFAFIPFFRGNLQPGFPPSSQPSRCFDRGVEASAKQINATWYMITMDFKGKHVVGCNDFYWIADLEGAIFPEFSTNGTYNLYWEVSPNASQAAINDISVTGFRVFEFSAGREQILTFVADTLVLFECFFTPTVSKSCEERNLYFLANYANVVMQPRTSGVITINASDVHDGDFFGVMRLDGIDPMLAWAMGSTTGHTTTALHMNNTLYVCESTTLDAYWPTNGVQCTEWNQWLQQCDAADMNVVWAPLSSVYSSMYNNQAAVNFFQSKAGLDYGWNNLLFGWLDTEEDNYPCVPPYPSEQCLVWASAEVLMASLERVSLEFVNKIFNQAMNIRLGTKGFLVAELMQQADLLGIPRPMTVTLVEEDSFVYNTTQNGEPVQGMSMVCCVFVCEMWKHAGLFSTVQSQINCAEFTNWDDYSLNIFDLTDPRPPQCVAADPNNQLCQLMGDFTLFLNDYSTKPEYAHMAENCPGQAQTNYTKPANC